MVLVTLKFACLPKSPRHHGHGLLSTVEGVNLDDPEPLDSAPIEVGNISTEAQRRQDWRQDHR